MQWIDGIDELSKITLFESHVSYIAFVIGLVHRFCYTKPTIPGISHLLVRPDKAISEKFIKNVFNRYCSEHERTMFSLPVKYGELSDIYYENSINVRYIS